MQSKTSFNILQSQQDKLNKDMAGLSYKQNKPMVQEDYEKDPDEEELHDEEIDDYEDHF